MGDDLLRPHRAYLADRVRRLVELHDTTSFTEAQKREWDILLASLCTPTVVLELARLATKGTCPPMGDPVSSRYSREEVDMPKVPLRPDHKIIRTLNYIAGLAATQAAHCQQRLRDLIAHQLNIYVDGPGLTSHESISGQDMREYPSAEFYRDLGKIAFDLASAIERVDHLNRIKLKLFDDGDFPGGQDVLDRILKGASPK